MNHAKLLTPRTVSAIGRLRSAGALFAVTSGRPPRGLNMIAETLQLTTPISGFNGGLVVKPDHSRYTGHRLAVADARTVSGIIRQHGLDAWLYTDTGWFVSDPGAPHVAKEQATIGFEPVVTADFEPHLAQAVKIVGVGDDPTLMAGCEKEVKAWGDGHVSARRSQSYYLDVTHPAATKGYVVRMLSDLYGIPPAQIATIGDGPNDVLMFRESGLSIAMGNAAPEVQQAATHVTASCDDEGFAQAIEQLILPLVRADHARP